MIENPLYWSGALTSLCYLACFATLTTLITLNLWFSWCNNNIIKTQLAKFVEAPRNTVAKSIAIGPSKS